jgi:hypothetical protein
LITKQTGKYLVNKAIEYFECIDSDENYVSFVGG